MKEPSLPEKILAIETSLIRAGIEHGFGGALALAYYAEPRSTIDVDVNVFVQPHEHWKIDELLLSLGAEAPADPEMVERDGWFRYRWGRSPIDIFFAYQDLHWDMPKASRKVEFGEDEITILGPEHLIVCKALFDRPKDWIDIEQMIVVSPWISTEEVLGWVGEYVPDGDTRLDRLAGLLSRA